MIPTDFYEAMADQLTEVVKRPFRSEPMTAAELDEIADRILKLCAKEKEKLWEKQG